MPQSLSRVYLHFTFSTKLREPLIDPLIRERLWEFIGGICNDLSCQPMQIGGTADHVHILCLLSRTVTQAVLVEEIKRRTSLWIKTIHPRYRFFYWQEGYGVFSVNPTEVDIVSDYIRNQQYHHHNRSFQTELRAFLHKYGADYDERYVWD